MPKKKKLNIKENNSTKKEKKKKVKRIYRRFSYSEDALKEALSAVKNKLMSANKASIQFKVPKGTLIKKLHSNEDFLKKMGPATVLSAEEENRIVTWIIDKARIGYPMHPSMVKLAIKSILDSVPRSNPFKNNMPGKKWFELFLKRHPDVSMKNTEVLSKSRAAVTEEIIRQWFAGLKSYLGSENASDILEEPSRILNMDETGVPLCPKTGKLLGATNEKNNYYISPGQEKENITVLPTYSADGEVLHPMIVYPYKRFPPKAVAESVPPGYVIGHSPSGWMTTDTFNTYVKDCLYKQLKEKGTRFPVLLLYDGHASHISMDLHNFCKEKKIILYCLYPNSTHILQPCDVGIFRPLKRFWKQAVALHSQQSTECITKINFAPLFHSAFVKASVPDVIKSAFKACGLYPFNPDTPDYSKCISTRRCEMKKNSALGDKDEDSNDIFISFIESFVPQNVLEEFKVAYENKQLETTNEQILYGIWKTLKEKSNINTTQQVTSEPTRNNDDCCGQDNAQNGINNTTELVIEKDSGTQVVQELIIDPTNGAILENVNDTTLCDFINQNVMIDGSAIVKVIDTSMLETCKIDVVNVLDNSGCNVQENDAYSNINSSGADQFSNEIIDQSITSINNANISTTLQKSNLNVDNSNIMDISKSSLQNSYESIGYLPLIENSSVTQHCNLNVDIHSGDLIDQKMNKIEKDHSFSHNSVLDLSRSAAKNNDTLVSLVSSIKPDPMSNEDFNKNYLKPDPSDSDQKVALDEIWKKALHFPEIKQAKKREKKKKQIFAITSEEWKKQQEEKAKKTEEEKKLKEFKKYERELKRKMRLEEVEAKRREKMNTKKAKEMQEKQKKQNFENLLKQKAQDLNLVSSTISSNSFNPKALANITNKMTATPIKKKVLNLST